MKYGIERQLPNAAADKAQRFHAALLLRLYAQQRGAQLDSNDPLDVAIAMMNLWDEGHAPDVTRLTPPEAGRMALCLACPAASSGSPSGSATSQRRSACCGEVGKCGCRSVDDGGCLSSFTT